MTFIKTVKHSGSKIISSDDGNIVLDQGSGTLSVVDNYKVVTEVSKRGFVYNDEDSKSRILIGKHPKTGDMVFVMTKNGIDVIEELKNG